MTVPVSVTDIGRRRGRVAGDDRPPRRLAGGASAGAPAELIVPPGGAALLPVTLTIAPDAVEGDAAGYVVLTQGARSRRIPYWAHVERPRFATATSHAPAARHRARLDARAAATASQRYRYPAYTGALGLPVPWRGGEKLYRFHLDRRAINVGVTVEPLDGGGLRPFLLRGLDENRVAGESGLPIDVGPSLTDDPVPSAGLYGAPPGDYAVAIDSAKRRGGEFRLRFWVNDVTPPALGRLLVSRGCADAARARDRRGLGRRSALSRVRAGAGGLVRRSRLPARLGRAHGRRLDPSSGACRPGATRSRCARATTRESRDALAISISPRHVRTRVIGLIVDARGAIAVGAAPASAALDARRQVGGG